MDQLPIDFARARRDDGIQRSAEHAGEAWRRGARGYPLEYLAFHDGPFMAEDVREYAEGHGFQKPPDGRAWGIIFKSAARERLIFKAGYAPAKSSNLSPKVQWGRL